MAKDTAEIEIEYLAMGTDDRDAAARCKIIKHSADGITLYDVVLENRSEKPIYIPYRGHPFDKLNILYYDSQGRLIGRFDSWGTQLYYFPASSDELVLRPGESYRSTVGIRPAYFKIGGRPGEVYVEVELPLEDVVARSRRFRISMQRQVWERGS